MALVSKRSLEESASGWAQGGIAAVLDSQDSIDAHIRDTLVAGAWLNDEAATRFVVENGRRAIEWLIAQGPFTQDASGYHLTREGGHSARRVIHVADATGLAVQETLTRRVHAHRNITVLEDHIAIDLITGVKLGKSVPTAATAPMPLDTRNDARHYPGCRKHAACHWRGRQGLSLYDQPGHIHRRRHRHGVACRLPGGQYGIHPVSSHVSVPSQAKSFPHFEAVRGNRCCSDGTRFMPDHDSRGTGATRHRRACHRFRDEKRGLDCVFLDIAHKGETFIRSHFPNIHARCLELASISPKIRFPWSPGPTTPAVE